jgi:hypothetical protein
MFIISGIPQFDWQPACANSLHPDPTHVDPQQRWSVFPWNVGVPLQDYAASKPKSQRAVQNWQGVTLYTRSDTRMRASFRRTCLYMNNRDESPAALGVSHCPTALVLRCVDAKTRLAGIVKLKYFKAQGSPHVPGALTLRAPHFFHTEYLYVSCHSDKRTETKYRYFLCGWNWTFK